MMAKARSRVLEHDWPGVDLICAPAATARVPVQADAALFHFTHDIIREEAAIANVLSHLMPGARVVAAGLQWAPPWMWPTNGFVLLAALYSVTSLEGLAIGHGSTLGPVVGAPARRRGPHGFDGRHLHCQRDLRGSLAVFE